MEKMTKKEMYRKGIPGIKTVINGETAIKPYYYLRGNVLHVRYTVDRAVELSIAEESKLKVDMSMNPADKQSVLAKAWNFMTACVGKAIIMDGVAVADRKMEELRKNGYTN